MRCGGMQFHLQIHRHFHTQIYVQIQAPREKRGPVHAAETATRKGGLYTRPLGQCSSLGGAMFTTAFGSPLLWFSFVAVVLSLLVLDLGVFHRRAHVVSMAEAGTWTLVWIGVSLAFAVLVFWQKGTLAAEEFLTGYTIEKALSVDNLFVIYVVFLTFRIPPHEQHRVLFWGIVGAIAMRTVLVFVGASLLARFSWLMFVVGGVLIWSGIQMLRRIGERPDVEGSRLLTVLRRFIPATETLSGSRMWVRGDGRWLATPLFLSLLFIEGADAVFAIDSIFAIFAITGDPFIVLTSNIFALLGLRSLYFVLARAADRFVYVQPGLALVLVFVGAKMALHDVIEVPVLLSLAIIVLLIGGSIAGSLLRERAHRLAAARRTLTRRGVVRP